ncbi:HlyC/CorC family transporter [bacterium]|nr:HlyC/CorC family transporter [bacterium]
MDDLVWSIIILVVLFLLSAFFSSAETAFTSVSKFKLETKSKAGDKRAQQILSLIKNPSHFFTVILLGNNIVNIAAASISTYIIMKLVKSQEYAVLISTFGVTFFVLIFGEIIPKSLASFYSNQFANSYYIWVKFFDFIFSPIIWFVKFITYPILKHVQNPQILHFTEEDVKHIIETSKENGVLDPKASELISNAVEFKDISVSEILTPRVDIFRLDMNIAIPEAIDKSIQAGFSRIPIMEESVDKIVGIAYLKDMIKLFYQDKEAANSILVKDIMRKPLRIPEDKKISDLLIEMRSSHIQMAIVIDEYGGTAGLVTIEDILEEIVGEIRDEYDEEEDTIIEFNQHAQTLITTGRADIGEINERLELKLPDDDYETIGGLVFNELGREVTVGDKVLKDGVEIIVEEIDGMNLKRVLIQKAIENDISSEESIQ